MSGGIEAIVFMAVTSITLYGYSVILQTINNLMRGKRR